MKKIFYLIFVFIFSATLSRAAVHLGSGQQFKNIQNAMDAGAIKAGDTVLLHQGKYEGYQGVSSLHGNQDQWIVIRPYQNDAIEISGTWQFMMCQYIKFEKLNFVATAKNPGRLMAVDNGGSCETQSRFIKFDSCSFSNVSDANAITAFKFGGVDDFEITNCTYTNMSACSAFDFNVCHNGIIRGNRIENCLTGGHIKGGASNITMERNIFINASSGTWVAFELGGDTGAQFYCPEDKFEVKNLNFFSNIIIGGYRGLALSSAIDCKVINNTFYNCGQATLRFLTTSSLYPSVKGNIIENNIFAFGSSAYINGSKQGADAASFSKNIYYSISSATFNGPYWDTPDLDPIKDKSPLNYGSSTSMFVDAAKYDFSLLASSPAVQNAKLLDEPKYDYFGKEFSKTKRSIGAVEFLDLSNIENSIENSIDNQVTIYPNPAQDEIQIYSNIPFEKVELFDFLGRKIQEFNNHNEIEYSDNKEMKIDISKLESSIYFLKIDNVFHKFFKK